MAELAELRRAARDIFAEVLAQMDAGRAVLRGVELQGSRLRVVDEEFDLRARPLKIYSVALGKAGLAMAAALDGRLGGLLAGGVVSAPAGEVSLSDRWRVFAGGHPLPNEASLAAARAASEFLRKADDPSSLVIFLVSGGGSAMIEWPRDPRVTLADLREANRVLVSCGASISEVNAVRRSLSAVKGGGLAALAPRAAQITLIISDTGAGRIADVASGPTLPHADDARAAADVLKRYELAPRLPDSITRSLAEVSTRPEAATPPTIGRHYVLLDNARACAVAADATRALGFAVEVARDLDEQDVAEGSAESVSRLVSLYRREGERAPGVCLISGGEFACPVRGDGVGGRNSETALRCAFEFEKYAGAAGSFPRNLVALCAGTDGVDGNSPAAGAVSDQTTLSRARVRGLDAEEFLAGSDAYTFFDLLGDALVTGPTGTNVRDVRVMLAA